jgi:hypothetical protein
MVPLGGVTVRKGWSTAAVNPSSRAVFPDVLPGMKILATTTGVVLPIGTTVSADFVTGGGGACTTTDTVGEKGPGAPPQFVARTR